MEKSFTIKHTPIHLEPENYLLLVVWTRAIMHQAYRIVLEGGSLRKRKNLSEINA